MSDRRKSTRRELLAAGAAIAGGAAIAAGVSRGSGDTRSITTAPGRPTLDEVDVLVVGGGPAGIGAAIGAARKGAKTLLVENHSFFGGVAAWASWYINHSGTADMGRVDATDPIERSRAECNSRRQALQMIRAIRESASPELQRIEWIGSGPQVSVRETRRVKGAYVITEEDAMSGRKFDDAIAWRSGFLDPGGQRGAKFVKMKVHDVPYRAIVPEKLDGLLMAGRCISTTHIGAMAGKSMGNCMATGHAAGVAAALSAKRGVMPREISVRDLQDSLRADGVDLEMKDRDQQGSR